MMIILVIIFIIFGAGKLPEIGGGLGKAISNFRNATKEQDIEDVRKSVSERMIAERKQLSSKFRAQGKGEAQSIWGDKELELSRIESEAYRIDQEVKGKADAEATRLYSCVKLLQPRLFFMQDLHLRTCSTVH